MAVVFRPYSCKYLDYKLDPFRPAYVHTSQYGMPELFLSPAALAVRLLPALFRYLYLTVSVCICTTKANRSMLEIVSISPMDTPSS
jgi:hypothetical protein